MWNGLQQASSVAQLAGVDAFVLITMIVRAAKTARRNKKTCRELSEQVERIGDLLRSLEEQPAAAGIMRRPDTSAPLLELHETLRRACAVVDSCRRGGYVRGLCAGGSRATSLRDVQSRIAFFLQLFPIISHLDSTRLLVQVIDSAAARAQRSGDGAEEVVENFLGNQPDTQDDDRIQNLSFSLLMNATNSFSFENQIEQGPLATLYKGQLHGNDVTVKRVSILSVGQQLPSSMSPYELFRNEVRILQKLQHKNIVKLMGFCAERSEKVSIYEYMHNGSLEDVIFVRMRAGFIVDWHTRFRIIEGVAQGAGYLHNYSRLRIIHRDLKPTNILLDSDMNPKISSFDLAKVLCPGMTQDTAASVVGSVGFIAPEYMKEGTFSVKTDVYSFGVMVLEIISEKRWTRPLQETYYRDLLTWAFKRTGYGAKMVQRLKGFVPPSLHGISFCSRAVPKCLSFPARKKVLSQQKEMRRCVRVALLCIQEKPERRPDMLEVMRMLRPRESTVPIPRRPGYAKESSMYAGDRSMTP
ncbi:unnamed protein product [Urochloa humidicola]